MVEGNYILPIIWHVLNPGIIHVVIPVVYNICIDFGNYLPSETMYRH